MTMMSAFRQWFSKLDLEQVFLHLWVDGSPQKRGMELYAASFDLCSANGVGGMDFLHHLMPQICIGIGSLSAYGKVMSLLWIIWLSVGPTYNAMRRFANRVFSFNTDYGTERSIVDYPDCLGDFYDTSMRKCPPTLRFRSFFFRQRLRIQVGFIFGTAFCGLRSARCFGSLHGSRCPLF
jgi:hypothetical protein